MKKVNVIILLLFAQFGIASVIDGYNVFGHENQEYQVPASSWYWDPNMPGIGFGSDGEGYVRISLVENEHRIRQAVRNIKIFFENNE